MWKETVSADCRWSGGKRRGNCQSHDPAGLPGDRKMAGRTAENKKAEDRNYRRLENVRGCTGGDLWIERGAGRQRKQDQLVYLPEKRTGHCGADEEGNRGGCSCHPGCRNIGRVWRAGRKWNIRGRGALWSGLQSEDNCTSG